MSLYTMDNLELLRQLPSNLIDLIYCDILFNTGKEFKDYSDKLGTHEEAIEWYRPRLVEMKRVLKDTGSIYLQCDWRLVHYLKVEMDKIFGVENFRNEIIWSYRTSGGAKNKFNSQHDTILFYSKTNKYTFNQQKEKSYTKSKGRKVGVVNYGKADTEFFEDEFGIYRWANMRDVWDIPYINSQAKERLGYDTQKPMELAIRIIKSSSNEGDLVADFFCGSGTTLKVAKELGRGYIGCDINPRAIEICRNRLEEREYEILYK